jgi:hypothetical protein
MITIDQLGGTQVLLEVLVTGLGHGRDTLAHGLALLEGTAPILHRATAEVKPRRGGG